MPLTLVTGPANAAKARVALDAYEAWARAGRSPLLVVPTSADAATYRTELATRGLVFGTTVLTPPRLAREVAARAGLATRPVGALTRERIATRAARRTQLRVLTGAAATAGFPRALLGLLDELAERRIGPARWRQAVRAWAAEAPQRADYAEDLGALVAAYGRGLAALGRPDERGRDTAALDALRADPARWGGTPVVLYGFDDLTLGQLDLVETLATRVGADVLVTLPYEAGRPAFAGRDHAYQELRALSPQLVELEAGPPAPGTDPALHALERTLFEPPSPDRPDPGEALLLLRGGGVRAELELVAAHVKRHLRAGMPASEIAIVLRRPADHAALLTRVLDAAEVPFALAREVPVGHTALGHGVLALARCALTDTTADDLLAWLRTPGVLDVPALADRLEASVRREGVGSAREARRRWEAAHFRLGALDRLAAAARDGVEPLCDALAAEARRTFLRPLAGRGIPLRAEEADDAAALRALEAALSELGSLARRTPELVDGPRDVLAALSDVTVRLGARGAGPGEAVWVGDPLGIRARRVRVLFLCGLQEGSFPAPPRPEPLLGDAERRALNAAAGLRLDLHEDSGGPERYLLYAAVSRPTRRLALSWHAADDAGRPQVRSPFVDDVLAALDPAAAERVEHRELGAAGWSDPDLIPTVRERERTAASAAETLQDEPLGPLTDPALLAELAATDAFSASALEAWHACPVQWFVERRLSPAELEPDPEPRVRGELAHAVLESVLGGRARGKGGARVLRPADAPALRHAARAALARLADGYRLSVNPEQLRAALHRLEADLVGYLEQACEAGSRYVPQAFEVAFGGRGEDEVEPVDVGGGLRLRGRIDRVDVASDGTALLYDYKGATATPQAKWLAEGKLQLALYLRAVPTLLELEAAGGLYQPLAGGEDRRPRGALLEGADPDLDGVRGDVLAPDDLRELLDGALELALRAAAELRAGALEPRPRTCGFAGGGCAYPSICRAGGL